MKATVLLKKQHKVVRGIFARIEKTKKARERNALVVELARNLAAHMVIEQEIFYPACAEALEDKDMIAEAFEEHGVAGFQLGRLLAVGATEDAFEAKTKVLKELIEHHVKEEEKELFKKAERAIGAEMMGRLGADMELRFEEQMKSDYRRVLAAGADARQATTASKRRPVAIAARRAAAKKPRARASARRSRSSARGRS